MVFVSVFLIRLWDDPAEALLLLSLGQHEGVLLSRPLLKRSEVEPVGGPVLMHVVDGMAGGQMPVGIPLLEQGAGGVRPAIVAVVIQIVAEIPCDVGESAETRDRIMDEPVSSALPGAGWTRLSFMSRTREKIMSRSRAKRSARSNFCQYATWKRL